MKKIFRVLIRFIKNIVFLLKFDLNALYKTAFENTKIIDGFLFNSNYIWSNADNDIKDEFEFIKTNRKLDPFPYPVKKIEFEVNTGFDELLGLPFVIHCSKRLYFTKQYSENMAGKMYKNYIGREQLLGTDISVMGGGKKSS